MTGDDECLTGRLGGLEDPDDGGVFDLAVALLEADRDLSPKVFQDLGSGIGPEEVDRDGRDHFVREQRGPCRFSCPLAGNDKATDTELGIAAPVQVIGSIRHIDHTDDPRKVVPRGDRFFIKEDKAPFQPALRGRHGLEEIGHEGVEFHSRQGMPVREEDLRDIRDRGDNHVTALDHLKPGGAELPRQEVRHRSVSRLSQAPGTEGCDLGPKGVDFLTIERFSELR